MEHLFTIGYMPDGSSTFTIKIKGNSILELFLFLSVPDSESAKHWLEDIGQVLEGNESHLERYGEIHRVRIEHDHTTILQAPNETTKLDTRTFQDLISSWAKTMADFRAHRKEKRSWHGIPTWLTPEEASDPQKSELRYWNPKTNEIGYFKDTPEGERWAEAVRKERNT